MKAEAFIVTLESNSQALATGALTESLTEEKAEKRIGGTWTARVKAENAKGAVDRAFEKWEQLSEPRTGPEPVPPASEYPGPHPDGLPNSVTEHPPLVDSKGVPLSPDRDIETLTSQDIATVNAADLPGGAL